MVRTWIYDCPVGQMFLAEYNGILYACEWNTDKRRAEILKKVEKYLKPDTVVEMRSSVIDETIKQLDEYFAGKRHEFDIPIGFIGTDFQKQVWQELLKVSYGITCSYKELAEAVGRPLAVRAVANTVRLNSISIIVPCHRIIGSNGTLTGYAGGLSAKDVLLNLERRNKL